MAKHRKNHRSRGLGSASGCLKQNGRLKKGCKFRKGGGAYRVAKK